MTQAISPYAELVAERDSLLREVEELRKDAERIEFLLDSIVVFIEDIVALSGDGKFFNSIRDAIDAAMKNETP